MEKETPGLAIASLVLGICGFFIPVVCSLLAIIFGFIALSKIKENTQKYKGRGLAVAGIVLGFVFFGLIFLILLLVFIRGVFSRLAMMG